MTDPVRIALLGNSFAARVQLPALRWTGLADVVGLAGHDPLKARATASEWQIPRATGDWRTLLDPAPDLVLITTPVDLHREMTLAALHVGAAVLCEKPFALDAAEARELVAHAAGRGAWLDHQLRWAPHVRRMRELVQEGFLGELWHARIEMFLLAPGWAARPWRWWYDAARGGGMLGALGSHLLDLTRWMLGEIVSVRAELATFVKERRDAHGVRHAVTADEYASLHLRFASGGLGELTTAFCIPSDESFFIQLTGSAGVLRLVDGERLYAGRTDEELEEVTVTPGLPTAESYGMRDQGIFARCLPLYLRDLLAAVAERATELPEAATFADGLAVQRLLDAARRSNADAGGWIDVP